MHDKSCKATATCALGVRVRVSVSACGVRAVCVVVRERAFVRVCDLAQAKRGHSDEDGTRRVR